MGVPGGGDGWADLVISEYGAAIWADPHRWIPEAARLLRPGGRLVFLGNSEGPAEPLGKFHLSHGDMIRLLRSSGFVVEDLVELRAPEGVTSSYPFVTAEWAARWPAEEVWCARRV